MLVCVDTNVMLHAFARGSAIAPIFRAIGAGKLRVGLSTSIVLEYEEICAAQGGAVFASKVLAMLTLVSQVHGTIVWTNPSYQFHTIPADPDDNKFADCAIAMSADYVITWDTDFKPLANKGYKTQPITPEAFIAQYLAGV